MCSILSPIGTPSAKQKEELLVASKEREKLNVNEIGWKLKYDKDTGDYTIQLSGVLLELSHEIDLFFS